MTDHEAKAIVSALSAIDEINESVRHLRLFVNGSRGRSPKFDSDQASYHETMARSALDGLRYHLDKIAERIDP